MAEVFGGVLALTGVGFVLMFLFMGPRGVRKAFGRVLDRRSEGWAGGLPARALLIVTAVMFALETGVAAGGAGSGLALLLIFGSAGLLAVAPNIAGLVLGVLGLLWAIPRMATDLGMDSAVLLLLLSLLAAALAGILRRG